MVFGEGFSRLAEAFRGYWWAFRVWPSISWVLVGISWVLLSISRFAEAFRGYWWAFRVLLRLFVGIGGLFVFDRAFRRYWWAFRVWPRLFVGLGGHFVFGKQASPGNIMFDTPKHSAECVFW